jgi:hypothetical protein
MGTVIGACVVSAPRVLEAGVLKAWVLRFAALNIVSHNAWWREENLPVNTNTKYRT